MKGGVVLKVLLFIFLLVGYMYFYDPSLIKFAHEFKQAYALKLNDHFLLNSVIWLVGFWGMVLFLNASHKPTRFLCWGLFIITAFFEYAYINTLKQPFSITNIDKIQLVFDKIPEIRPVEFMKFIGLTVLIIAGAVMIKPLSLPITKTFLVALFAFIVILLASYKGQNMVLPAFYLVPAMFIYKYLMVVYTYSMSHFN